MGGFLFFPRSKLSGHHSAGIDIIMLVAWPRVSLSNRWRKENKERKSRSIILKLFEAIIFNEMCPNNQLSFFIKIFSSLYSKFGHCYSLSSS